MQLDPLKILEWMWQMRREGRLLVVATVFSTISAIVVASLEWNSGWIWLITGVIWLIFIIQYLQSRTNFRKGIDNLITQGELLQAFVLEIPLGSLPQYDKNSENTIHRLSQDIENWRTSIDNFLKGTRWERQWMSNAGLTKQENEQGVSGFDWYLIVWRNSMSSLLKRLEDIRNSL